MRARVVVFPIKGRNWVFSRSVDPTRPDSQPTTTPTTFKQLWNRITSSSQSNPGKPSDSNVELAIDFLANKMNNGWGKLEKAPPGSFKSKIHGLGLRLLSRVKPSEIFLKSITKDVSSVEITYPSSLNPRLVRRRLRHIASRGAIIHRKYFYGSVTLLPLTSVFAVLPLPNIPFFWILFRTYSHWRALKGSEKLLPLVTESSHHQTSRVRINSGSKSKKDQSENTDHNSLGSQWVLKPSKELEKLFKQGDAENGLSKCIVSDICREFKLNTADVIKYQKSV